jgi:hypothetical protein
VAILGAGLASCTAQAGVPADCPTLARGANDQKCVPPLQSKLALLGYMFTAEVTGNFGPITDAAVRTFQHDRGLPEDGVATPALSALITNISPREIANAYGLLPACFRAPRILCANGTTRVAVALHSGVVVNVSANVFGQPQPDGRGEFTHMGHFRTTPHPEGWKAQSSLYENVPTPWFTWFSGYEGTHYMDGSYAPGVTSHGCIRLQNMDTAMTVWNDAHEGGEVLTYAT